jgi:hypothetical protein
MRTSNRIRAPSSVTVPSSLFVYAKKKMDQLLFPDGGIGIYCPLELTVSLRKLDIATGSQTAIGFLEYFLPFCDTCRDLVRNWGSRETRISNENTVNYTTKVDEIEGILVGFIINLGRPA